MTHTGRETDRDKQTKSAAKQPQPQLQVLTPPWTSAMTKKTYYK